MKAMLFSLLLLPVVALGQLGPYSLQFNGTTSSCTVTDNSIDLSGDFTVEFYVQFLDLAGNQVMFLKDSDPGMGHSYTWEVGFQKMDAPDNRIWFEVGSSTPWAFTPLLSTTRVTTGTWYHIAGVVSGTTMTLYVNGIQEATTAISVPRWSDTGAPVNLGSDANYLNVFNGYLDEVRVWGVAKDAGQITAAMSSELGGHEAGLQMYYAMSNGGGDYVSDNQLNGPINEGTTIDVNWAPVNFPLPVQLAAFKATPSTGGAVRVDWATASETNNYGFEVQRSASKAAGFVGISGLIAGHGTSATGHTYSYTDDSAPAGLSFYRLKQVDLDKTIHYSEPVSTSITSIAEAPVPTSYLLDQNYPNPFNPSTTIRFGLPHDSHVSLTIYNALGQVVAEPVNQSLERGYHEVRFDGSHLASGVYIYRIQAGTFTQTRTLVLIK